ncbi:hypothetical protein [Streptomyces sp. NEAU-W12]
MVLLVSGQSSFVLGANLYVDGGENQIRPLRRQPPRVRRRRRPERAPV